MGSAVIFIALNAFLTKYLLRFADYWTIFSFERMGVGLAMIPFLNTYLPELISTIKERGRKFILIMSLDEILGLLGILFFTIAASLGYVTLTSAISALQPFLVLAFTLLLSRFYPLIIKEETARPAILLKILATALLFSGVILIA
jgi:hypothetical protein